MNCFFILHRRFER